MQLIAMAALLTAPPRSRAGSANSTGTFERLFNSQSLWNARPIDPVLGTATIPQNDNVPYLEQGKYSTKLFRAPTSDGPVTARGLNDVSGIWVSDGRHFEDVFLHGRDRGPMVSSCRSE